MHIRWHNVLVLILVVVATLVAIRQQAGIGAFVGNITRTGPGHPHKEQFLGFLAFGVLAVCLVAIVRILTNNRKY